MRHRVLLLLALLWFGALPAHALRPGQKLPPPPTRGLNGAPLPTEAWLREALVVWFLFTPGGPEGPQALRWLAAPKRARAGYRVVGVPVADAPIQPSQGAATLPMLGEGHRWRPQLGLRVDLPVLFLTRPPGVVARVYTGADASGAALAIRALSLQVQREDWPAVLDVVGRAGEPLVDPTFLAARVRASLRLGEVALARDTAAGLAEVGPNGDFRALGRALLAEIARYDGDPAGAEAQAKAGGTVAEAQAALARIAVEAGDLAAARRAAERARSFEAVLPWSAGVHALLAAQLAWLDDDLALAAQAATDATREIPASWRAWQTLGLVLLRTGNGDGEPLLQAAAVLAPPEAEAAALADAAVGALQGAPAEPAELSVVLEAGSVPHAEWTGAGPTACVLLADALDERRFGGAESYVTSSRAVQAGHPFGAPLDAVAALAAAKRAGARYLLLLRMTAAPRGVVLNARVADTRTGALRGLDSMVWTPDRTLGDACRALAERIRARLAPQP